MPSGKTFYVYTLTDPRNGAVFYVGKGQGSRAFTHTSLVRRGLQDCNLRKCAQIKEIVDGGLEPSVSIVGKHANEFFAFEQERELIAATPNLTNIMSGYGWNLTLEESNRRAATRRRKELVAEHESVKPKVLHAVAVFDALEAQGVNPWRTWDKESQRTARQIMGAARVLASRYNAMPISLMVSADGN